MSWGYCDNGLKERQRAAAVQGRGRIFFDYLKVYSDLPETMGRL